LSPLSQYLAFFTHGHVSGMIGNRAVKKNEPQSAEETEKKIEFPNIIRRSIPLRQDSHRSLWSQDIKTRYDKSFTQWSQAL
jgi:hypothetical protein